MAETDSKSHLGNMFRALQYRNYRLFFMGQGVSLIGTWMQTIAMSWLVYRLTDSVFLLGMVNFANQIPGFILGPFAGVVSDKYNRHSIMKITQFLAMLQATTLAVLVLTDVVQIWQILALSFFLGSVNAFDVAARQALVVQLVERREDLSNAIALNSSLFNGARLIGPSIAGIIIALVGEGICFAINAVSYLAVLGSLFIMKMPVFEPKKEVRKAVEVLKEGFKYAFGFAPIRAVIVQVGLVSLFGMPFSVLMPVFARDILGGGANTLGYLMGASGVGALTGALYLASRKTVLGLGKIIIFNTVLFGVALMAFSFSRVMALSLVLMFFSGFGMIVQMSSNNTILQTIVDEDKRGRVMSFYAMAFLGMAPIGSLLAGAVAEKIGVTYTLFACGFMCVLSILPLVLQFNKLREMVRPIYQRLGILPEIASGLQSASNLTSPPEED